MSHTGLRTWVVTQTDKSAFVLGFLFQVINMCSDPLATEGLLPLMATRPNEGIDY